MLLLFFRVAEDAKTELNSRHSQAQTLVRHFYFEGCQLGLFVDFR
jgi:hypothetical protein